MTMIVRHQEFLTLKVIKVLYLLYLLKLLYDLLFLKVCLVREIKKWKNKKIEK